MGQGIATPGVARDIVRRSETRQLMILTAVILMLALAVPLELLA